MAWKPHVTMSWIISEREGIQARPSDERNVLNVLLAIQTGGRAHEEPAC